MSELFDHIDEMRRSTGRVAVATLVNTRGTTPRKEGARMVVGEGGAILGSVTIGGCVDAQVIEQAEDVLAHMQPRLLELNLGDEDAWEIGLTCGGTIEVFVEPMALDGDDEGARLYARARAHAGTGGRAAIVTRLEGEPGKLLVLDDGATDGTLGDRFLDDRFVAEARDALARGATVVCGGKADSLMMRATVLDHVTPAMRIYAEESFGPVKPVVRVRGTEAAIACANDNAYGLSAAVFGRDIARAWAVAQRIDSGICHINGPTVHDEAQMPFGGVKASGYGRFGGKAGIDAFTELRWLTLQTQPRHYPF